MAPMRSKEVLQGVQNRGFKKLDEIAKLLLKLLSCKTNLEGRDLNAVVKDDGQQTSLLWR